MNIKDLRHDIPIWNSGCAALMCIVFAAVSVEGCAIQVMARPGMHLACALLFLALAAALYRGIRPYRADAAHMIGAPARGRRARHAAIASALLLLGAAMRLLAGQPARPPLFLLASAWIPWLAETGAWLRLLLLKHRKSRALAAYPASG